MINYGLAGERLDEKEVKKYWKKLFMDEPTRKFLELLLWNKKPRF